MHVATAETPVAIRQAEPQYTPLTADLPAWRQSRSQPAGWLQVNDAGGTGAAYWNGSQLVDLGMHVDGHGEATAINDADDVLVGGSDGHGHTLFYYSAASQTMTPIEPLITNLGAWKFIMDVGSELAVLAKDGTIYGIAFFEGNRHAFKLVPSAH